MMIIKDFTIKTIQDTCKANKTCVSCPFYTWHCIFENETPDSWPMKIDDEDDS